MLHVREINSNIESCDVVHEGYLQCSWPDHEYAGEVQALYALQRLQSGLQYADLFASKNDVALIHPEIFLEKGQPERTDVTSQRVRWSEDFVEGMYVSPLLEFDLFEDASAAWGKPRTTRKTAIAQRELARALIVC